MKLREDREIVERREIVCYCAMNIAMHTHTHTHTHTLSLSLISFQRNYPLYNKRKQDWESYRLL
ncbi:hypothetical protein ACOSB0_00415, partial [Candidatus Phytoplasma citri]